MSTTFELNKTNVTAINITPKNSTQAVSLNYVQDEDKHILWYSGKKVSIGGDVYSYQFTGEQLLYSAIVSNIKNAGADVSKAAFNPALTNPTTVGDYVYGPIVPSLGNVWSDTISITEKYITFSVDPSYLNAIFSISKSASALGLYPGLSLSASCDQIDLYDIQTGGSELNSVADGDTNFNTILSYVQSGFTYQWERNNGEDYEDITGATSASYIIQNSDIGYEIRCKISFKGTINVAGSVDSNNKIFYTSWTDTVYNNKLDSSIFTTGQVKTYDGVERSVIPTSVTYDSSTGYYRTGNCYFTISGTIKGTAAQSYSYTVTPVGGTVWSDTGTSASKTFTWSIGKLTLYKSDYYDDGYYVWDGNTKEILLSSTSYVTVSGTTSATNAGTYTVKVTPDANSQWSDGTTGAYEITWTINKATINKYDYYDSVGYREWTGSTQYVTLSSTSYVTVSGTTSGTNAGTYSITFTPDSNHKWSDGTTGAYTIYWYIDPMTVSIPTAKTGLTYTGSSQTGVTYVATYYYLSSGSTSETNAGSYSATFTISSAYTGNVMFSNNSTSVTVQWSIAAMRVARPTAKTGLTYTGSSQTGVSYVATYYYLSSGSTSETNAGSYSATFTIRPAYIGNVYFAGNMTSISSVDWSISKADITNSMITSHISASSRGIYGWATITGTGTSGMTYTGYFRRKTSASGSATDGANDFTESMGTKSESSWSYNSSHYYGFRVTKVSGNSNWNMWTGSIGSGWNK